MTVLTLRATKGSPLTHNEVDANFVALRDGSGGGGILNVRDFGCTGDGITDDTENFQAALDALFAQARGTTQYAYGGRLRVPYGTYKLTRLNAFREASPGVFSTAALILEGDGAQATVLSFSDPDVGFEIGNASTFNISNMSFVGTGVHYGVGSDQTLIVMALMTGSGGTGVYQGKFENCAFGGAQVGVAAQAPGNPATPGQPGEGLGCSSEIRFENCTWAQCEWGFHCAHPNALDFIFTNCGMSYCAYGVWTGYAGGEVTYLGGSMSLNEVDFHTNSSENLTIIGTRTEGESIFLQSSGSGRVIVIGALIGVVEPEEGGGVVYHTGGSLLMEGCVLPYSKIFVSMGASDFVMRQCSVVDVLPFNAVLDEGVSSPGALYYRVEGCRSLDPAYTDILFANETGVMLNGGDKIPFTATQFLGTPSSLDASASGNLFHSLNAQTLLTNVATADPSFAGQIWSDAGTLKISAGNAWSQVNKSSGIKLANSPRLPLVLASYHGGADANEWASVLGSVGKSTGKWYFEARLVRNIVTAFPSSAVGVALSTMDTDGAISWAGTTASAGLMSDQVGATTGDVRVNTAVYATIAHADVAGLGYVEGDIIQVAVDTDADLIWFALNNVGTWNGGAGTPGAGTGGFDISAITGTIYPVVSFQKNVGTMDINSVMQLPLLWQGYFATTNYAPPTGFTRWA